MYHHANEANDSSESSMEQRVSSQAEPQRLNKKDVEFLPPNPVDKIVLHLFHGLLRRFTLVFEPLLPSKRTAWIPSKRRVTRAFEKCILAFCDLQIITGLGILVSGYLSLHHSLSAHHWKIVVYLAWFSNVTHQAALMFLRGYLSRHPVKRAFRIVFMVILYLMLLVAFIPTAFFNWDGDKYPLLGYPAHASQTKNSTYQNHTYGPGLEYIELNATSALPGSPAKCFFNVNNGLKLYDQQRFAECLALHEQFCIISSSYCSCEQIGDNVCNFNDTWWQDRQETCLSKCRTYCSPYTNSYEFPAARKFPAFRDTTAFQSVVVSTLILTLSFMIRISKLYGTFSAFFQVRVRSLLSKIGEAAIARILCWEPLYKLLGVRLWSLVVKNPLLALYILFRLFFDFYASGISDIFWLVLSGTIGTINVLKARNPVRGDEEGSWTFGQILPAFLLVGPVLMAAQEFFQSDDRETPLSIQYSGPDVSEDHQIESANTLEERGHTQTFSAVMTREHLNQILLKDLYTGTKWMKFAVPLVVLIHFTALAQLVLLILESYPVNSMATRLALTVVSIPILCYFLLLIGIGVENCPYETAAMITCFLYLLSSLSLWLLPTALFERRELPSFTFSTVVFQIGGAWGYLFIYFFFGSAYVICSNLSRCVRKFISRKRQRRVNGVDREGFESLSENSYHLRNM